MTTTTCPTREASALAELRRALGQPVDRQRADELDEIARRLGVRIVWGHRDLTTGEQREGRYRP